MAASLSRHVSSARSSPDVMVLTDSQGDLDGRHRVREGGAGTWRRISEERRLEHCDGSHVHMITPARVNDISHSVSILKSAVRIPSSAFHIPRPASAMCGEMINIGHVQYNSRDTRDGPGMEFYPSCEKSSRRAMGRPPSSSECFRLSLFGPFAFTPGPTISNSTFPSTSSNGTADSFLAGFGSFEGCVGYGRAEKYGWYSAFR